MLLHGAGQRRDELWAFEIASRRWSRLQPRVASPQGAIPPSCAREAVIIPEEDVFLTFGDSNSESRRFSEMWAYHIGRNAWYRVEVGWSAAEETVGGANQNRALVYDPGHKIVLLVLGRGGDQGMGSVHALRYRHK